MNNQMNCARVIQFCFVLFASFQLAAQTTNEIIYTGNEQFRKNQLPEADAQYRKALQQEGSNVIAKYNLGVSLYRQQKQDSSVNEFSTLTSPEVKNDIRSRAWFNSGAIYSEQNKLEESIGAYKNALRINPDDQQARENLQKALLEWKKRNPPKPEDKKKPKQQPPKQPPRPKLNPKQMQQKLKELEDKEKQAQQRMQKKSPAGIIQRDW